MFEKFQASMARRSVANVDAKRDTGLNLPDDVIIHEAISYGGDKLQTLDVNLPRGVSNPPLIINVSGGGYFYGGTAPRRFYCASLAQRGFAVVSFNYRLAPEHKFPTPLMDLNSVMEWCFDHAGEYGFDTGNIFMVGDSVGAQIASQYAAISSNADYAALMEITPPAGLSFRAIGLNCGMYDLPAALKDIGKNPQDILPWYFGSDPIKRYGKKLDVLRYINADYPPAYLISSPGDIMKKFCEPMRDLLLSRGVEAKSKIYGEEKTPHVFHVNMHHPLAKIANDEELHFFRRHIKE